MSLRNANTEREAVTNLDLTFARPFQGAHHARDALGMAVTVDASAAQLAESGNAPLVIDTIAITGNGIAQLYNLDPRDKPTAHASPR